MPLNLTHIDAIYCIVNPKFEADRADKLIKHIQQRLPSYPRSNIKICSPTWGSELDNDTCFKVYNPWLKRPGWPALTWKVRCLIKGEISLVLNFYTAMKDALENNYKRVLIFESDVFLRNDFEERLLIILDKLSEKELWDFVSLSDGVATHATDYTGDYMEQEICKPPHTFVFRCTDSMLFNTDIFKKIVNTILPFRDCLDWELNFQFLLHNATAFWAEPHIVEQDTAKHKEISSLPS